MEGQPAQVGSFGSAAEGLADLQASLVDLVHVLQVDHAALFFRHVRFACRDAGFRHQMVVGDQRSCVRFCHRVGARCQISQRVAAAREFGVGHGLLVTVRSGDVEGQLAKIRVLRIPDEGLHDRQASGILTVHVLQCHGPFFVLLQCDASGSDGNLGIKRVGVDQSLCVDFCHRVVAGCQILDRQRSVNEVRIVEDPVIGLAVEQLAARHADLQAVKDLFVRLLGTDKGLGHVQLSGILLVVILEHCGHGRAVCHCRFSSLDGAGCMQGVAGHDLVGLTLCHGVIAGQQVLNGLQEDQVSVRCLARRDQVFKGKLLIIDDVAVFIHAGHAEGQRLQGFFVPLSTPVRYAAECLGDPQFAEQRGIVVLQGDFAFFGFRHRAAALLGGHQRVVLDLGGSVLFNAQLGHFVEAFRYVLNGDLLPVSNAEPVFIRGQRAVSVQVEGFVAVLNDELEALVRCDAADLLVNAQLASLQRVGNKGLRIILIVCRLLSPVALRDLAFDPAIDDLLAVRGLRQPGHRCGPLVLRVQDHVSHGHAVCLQQHPDGFRPHSVHVVQVVPGLGHSGLGQEPCVHDLNGCCAVIFDLAVLDLGLLVTVHGHGEGAQINVLFLQAVGRSHRNACDGHGLAGLDAELDLAVLKAVSTVGSVQDLLTVLQDQSELVHRLTVGADRVLHGLRQAELRGLSRVQDLGLLGLFRFDLAGHVGGYGKYLAERSVSSCCSVFIDFGNSVLRSLRQTGDHLDLVFLDRNGRAVCLCSVLTGLLFKHRVTVGTRQCGIRQRDQEGVFRLMVRFNRADHTLAQCQTALVLNIRDSGMACLFRADHAGFSAADHGESVRLFLAHGVADSGRQALDDDLGVALDRYVGRLAVLELNGHRGSVLVQDCIAFRVSHGERSVHSLVVQRYLEGVHRVVVRRVGGDHLLAQFQIARLARVLNAGCHRFRLSSVFRGIHFRNGAGRSLQSIVSVVNRSPKVLGHVFKYRVFRSGRQIVDIQAFVRFQCDSRVAVPEFNGFFSLVAFAVGSVRGKLLCHRFTQLNVEYIFPLGVVRADSAVDSLLNNQIARLADIGKADHLHSVRIQDTAFRNVALFICIQNVQECSGDGCGSRNSNSVESFKPVIFTLFNHEDCSQRNIVQDDVVPVPQVEFIHRGIVIFTEPAVIGFSVAVGIHEIICDLRPVKRLAKLIPHSQPEQEHFTVIALDVRIDLLLDPQTAGQVFVLKFDPLSVLICRSTVGCLDFPDGPGNGQIILAVTVSILATLADGQGNLVLRPVEEIVGCSFILGLIRDNFLDGIDVGLADVFLSKPECREVYSVGMAVYISGNSLQLILAVCGSVFLVHLCSGLSALLRCNSECIGMIGIKHKSLCVLGDRDLGIALRCVRVRYSQLS